LRRQPMGRESQHPPARRQWSCRPVAFRVRNITDAPLRGAVPRQPQPRYNWLSLRPQPHSSFYDRATSGSPQLGPTAIWPQAGAGTIVCPQGDPETIACLFSLGHQCSRFTPRSQRYSCYRNIRLWTKQAQLSDSQWYFINTHKIASKGLR